MAKDEENQANGEAGEKRKRQNAATVNERA